MWCNLCDGETMQDSPGSHQLLCFCAVGDQTSCGSLILVLKSCSLAKVQLAGDILELILSVARGQKVSLSGCGWKVSDWNTSKKKRCYWPVLGWDRDKWVRNSFGTSALFLSYQEVKEQGDSSSLQLIFTAHVWTSTSKTILIHGVQLGDKDCSRFCLSSQGELNTADLLDFDAFTAVLTQLVTPSKKWKIVTSCS